MSFFGKLFGTDKAGEKLVDCAISQNVAVNFAPSAAVSDAHMVNMIHATDTRGTPLVSVALSISANETNFSAGAIRKSGIATLISNAGTGTVTYG